MIYSKGLDISKNNFISSFYNEFHFKPLSDSLCKPREIYYYDRHDLHQRHLELNDFINEEHWQLVRNGDAKILIDYADDFFNVRDITHICEVLVEKNVPSQQVYMLVMDPLWIDFATKHFSAHGLDNVHVTDLPVLLFKVVSNMIDNIPSFDTKRFSILSRNYRPWRLELYIRLIEAGVLTDDLFHYSFHNIDPYEKKVFSIKEILDTGEQLPANMGKASRRWIKQIPYEVGDAKRKYHHGTLSAIESSDIHVLIESHFDPFQTPDKRDQWGDKYEPDEWAPAAFITEKLYKAILCCRPFVVASTPYFLRDIKRLGYQTFEPAISEGYDTIVNDHERSAAIANEVLRLGQLSDSEFKQLVKGLAAVTEHNKTVLENYFNQPRLTGAFEWLVPYVQSKNLWLIKNKKRPRKASLEQPENLLD